MGPGERGRRAVRQPNPLCERPIGATVTFYFSNALHVWYNINVFFVKGDMSVMDTFNDTLERLFQLKERGTTVRTEIVAGLTTFLAMAYILAVNPSILGNVMDANGVFVATALASALATFLMAFIANYPIALSAGLGLNAYFAFTVCLGELKDVPDPWTIALTAVFVEGCIFILMSFFKFREKIVNGIPQNLKLGITAGIGLFITIIALKGAGIVVADESTLLGLGSFASPEVVLCLVGFIVIAVLTHYEITGAILIGILITWALGMIAQLTGWYEGLSLFPTFSEGLHLDAIKNTAFHLNFSWAGQHIVEFLAIVLSFLYVDLFDTVGTVVGVADQAGLLDKDPQVLSSVRPLSLRSSSPAPALPQAVRRV